jgi:hypothetical protein
MNRPAKTGDPGERALAARFAQLRVAERAEAPVFPPVESRSHETTFFGDHGAALAAGLAAAIAVFALFFVAQQPTQDPGELYARIMAANVMTTDQLMLASPGILPEGGGVPTVYDIEIPVLQEKGGNHSGGTHHE